MQPDRKRKGPAPDTPDLPDLATDQSARVADTVPRLSCTSAGCVLACSPSSCLGCADEGVLA